VLDGAALEAFRVRWLGTNGRLHAAMDALKSVPKEQKPGIGKRMSEVKAAIEGAFNAAKDSTVSTPQGPVVNVTEPGMEMGEGARHVLTKTIDEIVDMFGRMGFTVADDPELEARDRSPRMGLVWPTGSFGFVFFGSISFASVGSVPSDRARQSRFGPGQSPVSLVSFPRGPLPPKMGS
jgi:hypothetical protein